MNEKVCKICGKNFYSQCSTSKLCSDECRKQSIKTSIDNRMCKCKVCGATFFGRKGNIICSDECRNKNKHTRLNCNPKIVICKMCGTEFETNHKHQKYCSDTCSVEWRKTNPIHKKLCNHCGKEYNTNVSKSKYCSSECQRRAKKSIPLDKLNKLDKILSTRVYIKYGGKFEYINRDVQGDKKNNHNVQRLRGF